MMRIAISFLLTLLVMLCVDQSISHAQQVPATTASLQTAVAADQFLLLFELVEIDHTAIQQAGIELDPLLKSNAIQLVDTQKVGEYVAALEQQSVAKRLMAPTLVVQSGAIGILKNNCDAGAIDLQLRPTISGEQCNGELYIDFLTPNKQGSRTAQNFAFSYTALLGQTLLACSDHALLGSDKSKTHFVLLTLNRASTTPPESTPAIAVSTNTQAVDSGVVDPIKSQQQLAEQITIEQNSVAQSVSNQQPPQAAPGQDTSGQYNVCVQVVEIDLAAARLAGIELAEPKSHPSKSLGSADAEKFQLVLAALEKAGFARTIFAPQVSARSGERAVYQDNQRNGTGEMSAVPTLTQDVFTTDVHIQAGSTSDKSQGSFILNNFTCTTKLGQTFLYRKPASGSPTAKTCWITVCVKQSDSNPVNIHLNASR